MLDSALVYGAVGIALLSLFLLNLFDAERRALDQVPTVGPSSPLFSYIGAFRFLFDAPRMIQEGYDKFKGRPFKIANTDKWMFVVSGPQLIDDIRRAPTDVLSFVEAANDARTLPTISVDYTLGKGIHLNEYHTPIVRSQLNRNLAAIYPELRDEVEKSFDEIIVLPDDGTWVALPALDTVMKIVCRASNRVFVGAPVCRDPDYCDANVKFAIDVIASAMFLKIFPKFMRRIIGNMLTLVPRTFRRVEKHIRPLIEDRLQHMEEYGDNWAEKPTDILQWLLEDAEGEERTITNWTKRVMLVNFAAIHTTSQNFTIALFHLASNPDYLLPMREEVERVVKEEGWSKMSMQMLHKMDSFFRESLRYSGIDALSMHRKVMKPFSLSDGTRIPVGARVACAAMSVHLDNENYPNATVFEGFRFSEMQEEDDNDVKNQFVSTSVDYVPFGHGRHACPGRFFAAAELKTILAYLIVNYDIKLENEGVQPKDMWFGNSRAVNRTAKVMFRKRQR